MYNTPPANTDLNATQITDTQWAATAAIGEDNPPAAPDGVRNDGTNNAMAFSYGVIGGACDSAGGVDSPFPSFQAIPSFTSRKSIPTMATGTGRTTSAVEPAMMMMAGIRSDAACLQSRSSANGEGTAVFQFRTLSTQAVIKGPLFLVPKNSLCNFKIAHSNSCPASSSHLVNSSRRGS